GRDRRRAGLAPPAVGGPHPGRCQSVGLGGRIGAGVVGRGSAVLAAATVVAEGGWRRYGGHGGGGRQRAGVGGCCVVAATLLQVAGGSDRTRRGRGKLAEPGDESARGGGLAGCGS